MKHLKDYKLFESVNEAELHDLCEKYRIQNYTINSDGSVDVDSDVNLYNISLTKLPLKFNKVTGSFFCNDNQLTIQEGKDKQKFIIPRLLAFYEDMNISQIIPDVFLSILKKSYDIIN